MPRIFTLFAFYILSIPAFAQVARSETQANFRLKTTPVVAPIKIDGDLSEPIWKNADRGNGFWLKWPRDGEQALAKTEIQTAYDDQYLYVGVVCYDDSAKYILQSLKRDAQYWGSDGIAVVLDPVNLANNGYFFALSPAGVQYEGLISAGADEMDFNWDNVWKGETKVYADRWTAEFAIPFRILRYKEGQTEWGINFIRNDAGRGHYSTWTKIPLQFNGTDLGWTGALQWDKSPKQAKANYAIVPYASTSANQVHTDGNKINTGWNMGLDAKIGIGSAMNLDVTINPDFSQIEVDEQVINLTRFSIQLPEKRTFFLENADLFGNFGFELAKPFFSRRIGLDQRGQQIPILGGLRLTGNVDKKTRIGLLSMQTKNQGTRPGQNFSGLVFDRNLFGRTSLRGYFFNREAFGDKENPQGRYGRNAGGEFSYTSPLGTWSGWASYHTSMKPEVKGQNSWGNFGGQYTSKNFDLVVDNLQMGSNYYADLGYEIRIENYDVVRDTVLRIGYIGQYVQATWRSFPKKTDSKLNSTELNGGSWTVLNPNFTLNEYNTQLSYSWNLKNTSSFTVGANYTVSNVPVTFKFDEEDLDKRPALPAANYKYFNGNFQWSSDSRKAFTLNSELTLGQFYNGRQYSARLEARMRAQPWGSFRLAFNYNLLDFPEPYGDAQLFSITPRVEFFFNRRLFWTTFLQYNTQADNFNINSRLQWRFRPMSDFFVVFTDNYTVNIWGSKNRALVMKLNFWI
jgi:hypothetical protein